MARVLLFVIGLIALGTLSSRLLGVRLSWRMRLFASILGFVLGGMLTGLLWSSNPDLSIPPVAAINNLFFTMVMAGVLEMLAQPGRLANVERQLLRPARSVARAEELALF